MISQNHNGLGNPNHDNKTGQFTSNGAGSNGSDKKVNIKSEQGKSMKIGKDLSQKEYSFLKKSGMVDKYAKQAGLDRPKQDVETVDDFVNWSKSKGYDFSEFFERLKDLDKTKMARILKFMLSGFDFNKLRNTKRRYKLNEKVFKKPDDFKKVSDEEVRQLNMDKVALNKEIQENNETKKALQELRKQYDRVQNVATEEQQRKIELLFSKILNRTREKEMAIKEKNLENKEKSKDIQDRFVKTNKMFKKGEIN